MTKSGAGSGKAMDGSAAEPTAPAEQPKGLGFGRASIGTVAAFIAATFSSLAGVYFESVVKANEANAPSLWLRNVQLCVFTIPLAAMAVGSQWQTVQTNGITTGLDTPTICLITLNASGVHHLEPV